MVTTSSAALVTRPFEGLAAERDLVAMRQLIPAATLPARTTAEHGAADVLLVSVLPMGWAAVRRQDGPVLVGLQTTLPGNDVSRALGQAIVQALAAEPGTPVERVVLADDSPRLQDILDPAGFGEITVADSFDFWIDPAAPRTPEVEQSLAQADEAILPTKAVDGLDHGFWVDAGAKEHLRWVLDAPEDRVIDAVARLHAKRESGIGEGTRYVGSFRAEGLSIPVWDLPKGFGVEGVEKEAEAFRARFLEALESSEPLTAMERRARGGIVARQVTLR